MNLRFFFVVFFIWFDQTSNSVNCKGRSFTSTVAQVTGYEVMVVEESVQVGARIESEGYYATVKFVGDIPGTKGKWILDISTTSKYTS